ncbi:hypothetical protein BJ875DRAFT_452458 [Amylocarpus encephaloides]|uniref:SET domain-containing protein n=1 Tax=Amylocarpus encephaloides TaxID=45428 RepID=A0A9P8C900_9HELO|nr:hypothetical protein BJ875DRAFT_452458 [Amylocarpus encephaloides]
MESSIATKLKALTKEAQQSFLSLHNNYPGKYPFSGIVKTNALPCGAGAVVGGVYPTLCFINHSCRPNTNHNWNELLGRETIHATHAIKAGEEITISYDDGNQYEIRQRTFKDAFGFTCSCTLCSLPETEIHESDIRRREMSRLDEVIGDGLRLMSKPEDCLADCHSLLGILEVEYERCDTIHTARLYYDAFQIAITHGDQARARVFGERAHRVRVICEGEDSPASSRMKTLASKPDGHRNFGASRKWRTTKEVIPKGLSTEEFETWLWRERR